MAASSQIGNIDQEFFPYSIDYKKLLILKLFWVQQGWAPQEDMQKLLCQSWFSIQNQSFGNRAMMIMMYYWRFWDPAQMLC